MFYMIVIHSVFLCGLLFLWYRKVRHHVYGGLFLPAVLLKVFCGFLVGWLYLFWYEGGDTMRFFREAVLLKDFIASGGISYPDLWLDDISAASFPEAISAGKPRVFVMVKLLTGLLFITGKHYWLVGVYMSLISFWGCWRLAVLISRLYPQTGYAPFLALLFFPSVVFWSSGVLKESFMMGFLSVVIYLWLKLLFCYSRNKVWYIPVILILLSLLWQLKYYYAAPLIPLMICFSTVVLLRQYVPFFRKSFSWIGVYILIFICCVLPVMWWHPNLNPDRFLFWVVENHDRMVELSSPGAYIDYGNLEPTFTSILFRVPQALMAGLFRPFLWEVSGVFEVMAGLENFLVLVLSATACGSFLYNKTKRTFITPETVTLLIYIVGLATLLALASPNLGALNRYRVGFYPFWIILVLINQPEAVKKYFRTGFFSSGS